MRMFFRIAVRNLLQAKRRTLLLSMALGLVTALLVLLLASLLTIRRRRRH